MFPLASPAGALGILGNANFAGAGARIGTWGMATAAFGGDLRTLFRSMHPNQNTVFGAVPNGTAVVAAIQVYSTDNLGPNGFGYRYGDLRTTPGFIQLTAAALGPAGNNALSPGPPSSWPLRFFVNGRSHVVDINGGWSFNNGQTILDFNGFLTLTGSFRAPQIGLNVTPNANTVQIGVGGILQFDRPDGANSFQNSYSSNDLLLRWNFNAGSTIMFLDNVGNLAIAGSLSAAGGVVGLPTPAMVRIAQVVVASAQTTVEFASIPAGYSNLLIVSQSRDMTTGSSDTNIFIKFNGDATAANYDAPQALTATGTTAGAATPAVSANGFVVLTHPNAAQANHAGVGQILIPNYAGTTFYKQALGGLYETFGTGATPSSSIYHRGGEWKSVAAINDVILTTPGQFAPGSTFTLYGLA